LGGGSGRGALAWALQAAYALRFDFSFPPNQLQTALIQLPLVLLVQASLMRAFGAYSFVWRYVGMAETRAFVRAFGFSAAVLLGLRLGLPLVDLPSPSPS
jgi:FlaA1/EpsC-like NDP-sugar epimerase